MSRLYVERGEGGMDEGVSMVLYVRRNDVRPGKTNSFSGFGQFILTALSFSADTGPESLVAYRLQSILCVLGLKWVEEVFSREA